MGRWTNLRFKGKLWQAWKWNLLRDLGRLRACLIRQSKVGWKLPSVHPPHPPHPYMPYKLPKWVARWGECSPPHTQVFMFCSRTSHIGLTFLLPQLLVVRLTQCGVWSICFEGHFSKWACDRLCPVRLGWERPSPPKHPWKTVNWCAESVHHWEIPRLPLHPPLCIRWVLTVLLLFTPA